MRRPGENEGDLRKDEWDLLPLEERKKYKIMVYDEDFLRGGYEDVSLFLRARDQFGKKLVMSGTNCYWHKQGATRWNCENNGYINNFGYESKRIEDLNLERFIEKWGFNPHQRQIWTEKELWVL